MELRNANKAGGYQPMTLTLAVFVFSAAMVNPLAFTALLSILPEIKTAYASVPHAGALVRGLVSVVSVALVVAAPVAGYVVERYGMRRTITTAIAVFTVAGVSGYFIDDLRTLLASRVLLGFSDAFIGTLTITLVAARLEPQLRNRWIGYYTFAAAIGAFIFIPLSGQIARLGWRYVFLLYSIGLVALISAALALKGEHAVPPPAKAAGRALSGIFPLGLIAIGLASGAVENTTHVFLPFHLAETGETVAARISQALLPIAVGGALSAFFYGRLRTRFSVAGIYRMAFLAGSAALVWLGLSAGYSSMLLAASCLGLAVGLLAPNLNAYAADHGGGAHSARNIGFARGAFFAGAPIAQVLLEPIAGSSGAGSAIVALGIASFVLGMLPLARRRQPSPIGNAN